MKAAKNGRKQENKSQESNGEKRKDAGKQAQANRGMTVRVNRYLGASARVCVRANI